MRFLGFGTVTIGFAVKFEGLAFILAQSRKFSFLGP